MKKNSYAKINLSLNIINNSKPKDFHDLDMINFTISLKDTIKLSINKKDSSNKTIITSNNPHVPTNNENIVYKVVEKFRKEKGYNFSCKIHINKKIPLEAGLAGGSGNAAVVLDMLDKFFKTKMVVEDKASFLETLTSDGPYMSHSCPCRVKGKGNLILPFKTDFKYKIFLVKPKSGCSTKEIYDSINYKKMDRPDIETLENALKENNFEEISKNIGNSLLISATKQNNDILDIITRLKTCGFNIVSMTGSGSACFAISNKSFPYKHAKEIFDKNNYELVGIYKIR